MSRSKADPGDVVRYKKSAGSKNVTGEAKVTSIVRYPGSPAVFNLDDGMGVKAREITEVIRKS